MRLSHLSLPVADQERSRRFYASHGFMSDGVRDGEGCLHLTDEGDFDLALSPSGSLHFGIRLESADAVRAMRAAIDGEASPLFESADKVAFQYRDPDGHRVELYWQAT
jgi:catechol 2,3-dioxygenase-like lactoylglutathione lyase family enzyme